MKEINHINEKNDICSYDVPIAQMFPTLAVDLYAFILLISC